MATFPENLPLAILEQLPGMPPPPGQVSNFVDPPNLLTAVVVVLTISSILMIVAVGLRVYSKLNSARSFSLDDYTTFLAMSGSFALFALIIDGSLHHGTGVHQWNVRLSTLTSSPTILEIQAWFAIYPLTVLLAKLSLFILYLRLFGQSKLTRIFTWIGVVTCTLYYIIGMIYLVTVCSPWHGETRAAAWVSNRCSRSRNLLYVTSAFNVISDFYLVVIPIPVVMGLHMSTEKKIRVCSIFMLGFLGCICGIVNVYYRVLLKDKPDTTYNTAPVQLGSIIENTVGIIVGCMPVIQPAIISRFAKACRLFSVRSLISHFSSKFRSSTEAATGSEKSPKEDASSKRIGKPYLETEILHGADGNGKFMSNVETKKDPQSSWLSRSRNLLGTWTSGRTNDNHTTANGTQLSDQNIMTTTSISSGSHSNSSQGRDTDRHYMLQGERIRNMI